MRVKILLLIALLLPLSLFSYEINFNKRFTKLVTPDVLTTAVNISIENKSEKFINEHIEKFNKYIKSNMTIEKSHGSITLSPKYKYFKNTQKFIAYYGNLRYTIKSENANSLNRFIDDLITLENKFEKENVKLKIANVSWTTSRKLYNDSLDSLRLNAITWIESYSKSLKKQISKDCVIKSINIDKSNNQFLKATNTKVHNSRRISDLAPINTNQEIKIEVNFLLECK